jgi:hypothetical protein
MKSSITNKIALSLKNVFINTDQMKNSLKIYITFPYLERTSLKIRIQ